MEIRPQTTKKNEPIEISCEMVAEACLRGCIYSCGVVDSSFEKIGMRKIIVVLLSRVAQGATILSAPLTAAFPGMKV